MPEIKQGWKIALERAELASERAEQRKVEIDKQKRIESAQKKEYEERFVTRGKKYIKEIPEKLKKGFVGKVVKTKKGYRRVGGIAEKFKVSEGRRIIGRRATGTRGILKAAGIIPGQASQAGAGRPRGTYKYGMPIQEYKRVKAQERAMMRQFQQEQISNLRGKGLSQEQIQQLQFAQSAEEIEPEAVELQRFRQRQMGDSRRIQAQQVRQQADEEMQFRKWSADRTVSPNTQRMIIDLRRVQNMGKTANIDQQRRHFERRLLSEHGNLMRAHENMNRVRIDFTGVNGENILMAPSVFKENPENNILRTKRFNIMQTREAGNNLKFF